MRLLTRLDIKGKENIPTTGSLILAGNHVAVLEAALMVAYSPRIVEVLGTGDIPLDPNYRWLANLYGFIPINRGNLDRGALMKCLGVLAQDGVIGIFPEGGIWNPAHMHAQTGISLLSYKAQAPVVPIGFGGMRGALGAALQLKRPHISMHVGSPIPPVSLAAGESIRDGLERSANKILGAIDALLPQNELQARVGRIDESFELDVQIKDSGQPIAVPQAYQVPHGSALAHLFYTPVLLDALLRNLKLPILPLRDLNPVADLAAFQLSLQSILDYLEVNPGFFTYRFGMEEGISVQQALKELKTLVGWAEESACQLFIDPIQTYKDPASQQIVYKSGGDFPKSML